MLSDSHRNCRASRQLPEALRHTRSKASNCCTHSRRSRIRSDRLAAVFASVGPVFIPYRLAVVAVGVQLSEKHIMVAASIDEQRLCLSEITLRSSVNAIIARFMALLFYFHQFKTQTVEHHRHRTYRHCGACPHRVRHYAEQSGGNRQPDNVVDECPERF